MKIYTKTGDKGTTALIGGTRVSKADIRLEAYGTADELNSFIGLLRSCDLPKDVDVFLQTMQNDLFTIGGVLATDVSKVEKGLSLSQEKVAAVECKIDELNALLPPLKHFILPAGTQAVSLAHVCRTVTRRLERCMVRLLQDEVENSVIYIYVNRISDFFFVLARFLAITDEIRVVL